jgi:RsiW-degrading membrane proteinase PrsW (M82 family)
MILILLLVAILLAFIPAFFFSWFIYWLDRYEREPVLLLFVAFFWGGFIAIIGAVIGSLILDQGITSVLNDQALANLASSSITAPIVEEFWKGLAILIVFLLFRKEFDSTLDGIVYGAIIGLGFAATENVFYFLAEGDLLNMFIVFFLRVGIFAWGHAFYTAFTGIGFAVARNHKNTFVKIIAPLGGYLLAVFFHSFHNTSLEYVKNLGGSSVLGGFGLLILVEWFGWFVMLGFIIWMIRREQGLLKKHLVEEVSAGLLSAAQYNTAVSFFQFGARMAALRAGSLRTTSRFYQVCGELAHKKEQLAQFGDEKGNEAFIARLRTELATLAPQAK